MSYRCEATSLEGFVQQLAAHYLPNGYFFFVTGRVPERKDPRLVDVKLIARFGVLQSKWARARRKRAGEGNFHYLRFGHFFVVLATHGHDRLRESEGELVRDARRQPIRIGGYAISHRGGHAHVRIDLDDYRRLKAYFLELATRASTERLYEELRQIPFEPYAPVRRQLLNVLRATNRARGAAGLEAVPYSALRLRRRIVKAFEDAQPTEGV